MVQGTPDITDLPDGINQTGLRNHNERLVLSMIQRHGSLASADVARKTNLSAQTASVITRALEAEGLLRRGDPVRGKVGKPSVPMQLHPDGVLSYGLKIGRRTADLLLMDFTGRVRAYAKDRYPYPTPDRIMAFLDAHLDSFASSARAKAEPRFAGIGIAAPHELWKWLDAVEAPKRDMAAWKGFSFDDALGERSALTVFQGNDATLSCAAEHVFGTGPRLSDFAYFYIGSFVGGGVILNNAVHAGRTGNAGAFGTLPVRDTGAPDHQLIHNASIYILERALTRAGLSADGLYAEDGSWEGLETHLLPWIDSAARHLATASVAVASVLDFQAVVIDGGFPDWVRAQLVARVNEEIGRIDTRGIERPVARPGTLGRTSGAMGAAYLPIQSKFLLARGQATGPSLTGS